MFEFIIEPMMNLGTMIMQTSTGNSDIDNIVAIILAVAAIAGVAGSFFKMFDKSKKVGAMLDTFSQKTVENEEMMYRVGSAVRTVIPEIEEPLKKHGADLTYLKSRVTTGAEQLELLRALALKEKERARSVNMPRESTPVF